MGNTEAWQKAGWRSLPIKQQPQYPDESLLNDVERKLSDLPPLIFAGEVHALKAELSKVSSGVGFVLQGGDCAESFDCVNADTIKSALQLILQAAFIIALGSEQPVVKVMRIAGQYAKPRSSEYEERGGVALPVYRGDIINDVKFDEVSRTPDPNRRLQAYFNSAVTQNLLRGFCSGGFASLRRVSDWNKDFLVRQGLRDKYQGISSNMDRIIRASSVFNPHGNILDAPALDSTMAYTSHEALLLNYEEALTRQDSITGAIVNCSAHMLWLGERTRDAYNGHVHYLSGISNPIGIKVGPNYDPDDLLRIIDTLNPSNEPGKITLITRFGASQAQRHLPGLIGLIHSAGKHILWMCDPMHGNTEVASNGLKTRRFENIVAEMLAFIDVHHSHGSHVGGLHLEMTGLNVCECLGGASKVLESDLERAFQSKCDPRLNAEQVLELSFALVDRLSGRGG